MFWKREMGSLKWAVLAALVFLLQTQSVYIRELSNLTVLLVYCFGLKTHHYSNVRNFGINKIGFDSVVFGVTIGLIEDGMSGSIIGPGVVSKGLMGLVTPAVFTDLIFEWTPLWGAIVVIVFTFMDGVVMTGSRILFTGIHVTAASFFQILVVQSFINMPFGALLKP
jgi:hypothetical protein